MPKVYAEDPGVAYAVSRANRQDVGKRLETAVYIVLRRRNAGKRAEIITSLTVPSARWEKVDFPVGDALGREPYALCQITVDMTAPKTREWEVSLLEVGMRLAQLGEGMVVALRGRGGIDSPASKIRVVPAWERALTGG